jgi:RND family efflux transporter MFP subunit
MGAVGQVVRRLSLAGIALVAALSAVTLAGCDGAGATSTGDPEATHSGSAASEEVLVAVARAVPDVWTAREVGRLLPWRSYTVAAVVPGRVLEVRREAGEVVPADDRLVVRIESDRYEAAEARARAALAAAEARRGLAQLERDRAGRLRAQDQTTEMALERAEAQLAAAVAERDFARAELEAAALDLESTRVRLDPGLVVAERLVEPWAVVGPGAPLVRAVDTRRLRLRFDIPGDRLDACVLGRVIRFEVKGRDVIRTGTVCRVGPDADPRSRRVPVELEVANPEGGLLAGMVAVALLEVKRSDRPLVVVPRAALDQGFRSVEVIVIDAEGACERRAVRRVDSPHLPPGEVAIRGIDPDERVALEHTGRLTTGDRVRVRTAPAAAANAAAER